ncbi:MAG: V-type ATPase subunit [Candidatus Nomurabacteria bacterium]|nr:MAG: V-type ATPase subunit [Candidatus Nomurabacteria bacterium]
MSRDDYLYAAGVVRHLESNLLNPTDVERMVDAPDMESAFRVFHDTDYFDNVGDIAPAEFNQSLEADLLQAKERIIEMCPDEKLVALVFMRHDYHNLKLLMKQKYFHQDATAWASPLSTVPFATLQENLMQEAQHELPDYIQRGIDLVEEKAATVEVQSAYIDRWLDRQYFAERVQIAQEIDSQWIMDLVVLQIDMANLKTWIRGRRFQLDDRYLLAEVLMNGNVTLDDYESLLGLSNEEALQRLTTLVPSSLQPALERFRETDSLETLERDLENAELAHVREAQFIDYGPELPLAYYYAKKNAIRNVRLIMSGKLNGLPGDAIKPYIRELY